MHNQFGFDLGGREYEGDEGRDWWRNVFGSEEQEFGSSFGRHKGKYGDPADYLASLFERFDPELFKQIGLAMSTVPVGFDTAAYETGVQNIMGTAGNMANELAWIARAQGYGDDSGSARAMTSVPYRTASDEVSNLALELEERARQRPMYLAQLINSILDPRGTQTLLNAKSARDELYRSMQSGFMSILGQMLSGMNFMPQSNETNLNGMDIFNYEGLA